MTKYGYMYDNRKMQFLVGRNIMEQDIRIRRMKCDYVLCDMSDDIEGERKNLNFLRGHLKAGDVLAVTRLEILGKNIQESVDIVKELTQRGALVQIEEIGLIDNSSTGEMFFKTITAIQEFEKSLLFQKAAARKEISKTKNGYIEGRPRIPEETINAALAKINDEGYSYKQAAKEFGISEATLYKAAARKRGDGIT